MSTLDHPLLIVSDVHLGRDHGHATGAAFAALCRENPECEIVLNGDTFDLSVDPPTKSAAESVREILVAQREVREVLRDRLLAGRAVSFIAGNHDAAIATVEVTDALRATLEVDDAAPLAVVPWFLRRGSLHVEHGHLYDPDNAPNHPLATWSPETEPLGVALTRQFLAPQRALQFLHSSETTPLAGFVSSFKLYGLRTPRVIYGYFATAARFCVIAGRQPGVPVERHAGAHRLAQYAEEVGLDADVVRELAVSGAPPRHHRASSIFFRLYLDRVLATVALFGSAAVMLAGSSATVGVAAVSATYLGFSIARGVNRYGGQVEARLRDAAQGIRGRARADLVVLGHSHRADTAPGYLNPGSFGYPERRGRGFVRVERSGHGSRGEWPTA